MHIDTLKCSSVLESKGLSKPIADAVVSMAANFLEKVVTKDDIAHFATKQDLLATKQDLKQEISELRHELKQDISDLRQEMGLLRADMYKLALMQTFALAGVVIVAVKFL